MDVDKKEAETMLKTHFDAMLMEGFNSEFLTEFVLDHLENFVMENPDSYVAYVCGYLQGEVVPSFRESGKFEPDEHFYQIYQTL